MQFLEMILIFINLSSKYWIWKGIKLKILQLMNGKSLMLPVN